MIEILAAILPLAGMAATGWLGYAAGCRKTTARNAAHAECLGCSHIGPDTALRAAQLAAQAHAKATGHVAMVVSKHG